MVLTPFLLECNYNSSPLLLQSSYLRPLRSLLGLLFLYDHHRGRVSMAASGGSMGGSDFSSNHDHSYSDYSYSCSGPTNYSSGGYSHRTGSWASRKQANEVEPLRPQDVVAIIVIFLLFSFIVIYASGEDPVKTSVVKLQAGLLATGRSLQGDLNWIAEVADTSTKTGWHFVLQESLLSLLRHSRDCISGYSSVDVKSSPMECEKRFNQLSVEERGKFDEQTLININNIRTKSASQSSNWLPNEYIVVTVIVAARDVPELPPIKNSEQLKKALRKLASIPSSNIMGVQVLWTPQKEDDSLTKQKMLKDYPLLRPL